MSNFIEDLKNEILKSMPDASPIWALYCAIAPLATILKDAKIIEQEKPMRLNLMMLMVAPPGIKKSLPMTSFTYPILKGVGELIGKDLILPSRSSVPGFIKEVNRKVGERKDKDGKIIQEGTPTHDQGIIMRDEFSAMFEGMRKDGWQSDGLEFISEMYDGIFQKRATTSHGLNFVENLYANLISCTTYRFLSMMDPEFFIQGTGNRFLYCHYSMEDYKVRRIDWETYFKETWESKRNDLVNRNAKILEGLYNRHIEKIYVTGGGELYADYKEQCEIEWKRKGTKDPVGWDYHPIKRYPEFALKLAGIYAISARYDQIIGMPEERWDHSVSIEKKNMERAIATVGQARKHFKEIIRIKEKLLPRAKVESQEDRARALLITLRSSKYGMLNAGEWREQQIIAKGERDFHNLRMVCESQKYVEVLTWKDLTPEERENLDVESHHVKFYRCAESIEE